MTNLGLRPQLVICTYHHDVTHVGYGTMMCASLSPNLWLTGKTSRSSTKSELSQAVTPCNRRWPTSTPFKVGIMMEVLQLEDLLHWSRLLLVVVLDSTSEGFNFKPSTSNWSWSYCTQYCAKKFLPVDFNLKLSFKQFKLTWSSTSSKYYLLVVVLLVVLVVGYR
jgi:hypothetical protein